MERNKRKIGRWLGVLAAVLVPAIATAALTIPNTFTSGTVIKSADVNANFAAVATAVSSDQATIGALQSAVATLQTQVASLQTTVTTLQTSLTSVQGTVAATPQVIGFAHFNTTLNAAGIASFGGSETTSVTAAAGFPTIVTFTGKFPASITAAKVHILATPEVGDYTGLDAAVQGTPTSTSISIRVYTWETDNIYYGYQTGGPFFIALLLGS